MAQVAEAQSTVAERNNSLAKHRAQSFDDDMIDWADEEEPDWSLDWEEGAKQQSAPKAKKTNPKPQTSGLKKNSLKVSATKDMPPTPLGHEWRETEGGWNLIRCWSEKDSLLGKKVKKERYAGYLSRQAWQVIKEYEHEKIISQIGQQLRRHGGR